MDKVENDWLEHVDLERQIKYMADEVNLYQNQFHTYGNYEFDLKLCREILKSLESLRK